MKFSLSNAWNDAISLLSKNRELVLINAGLFFFVPAFLSNLVMENFNFASAYSTDPTAQEEILALYGDYWWLFLLTLLLQLVGYFVLLALLGRKDKPTVAEALKSALPCMGAAFLAYLLLSITAAVLVMFLVLIAGLVHASVATVLGVACLLALIYALTAACLFPVVLAVERVYNPYKALKRSFAITSGHVPRLLGFFALLFIGAMVAFMPLILISSGLIWGLGESAGGVIASLLNAFAPALFSALYCAIIVAIYNQLAQPKPDSRAPVQFD